MCDRKAVYVHYTEGRNEVMKSIPRAVYFNVGSILIQLIAPNAVFLNDKITAGIIVADVVLVMVYTVFMAKCGMRKRICRSCGLETTDDDRVCSSCGGMVDSTDNEDDMFEVMCVKDNNLDEDFERIEQMSAENAFVDNADILVYYAKSKDSTIFSDFIPAMLAESSESQTVSSGTIDLPIRRGSEK